MYFQYPCIPFYLSVCCLPAVLSCHFLDLKPCKFKCIQLLAEIRFEGNLAFIFFSKLAFTWSVKYLATGEMVKVRRKARPVCKKQLKTMLISMPCLPWTLALKFFLLWALDMIWKWGRFISFLVRFAFILMTKMTLHLHRSEGLALQPLFQILLGHFVI